MADKNKLARRYVIKAGLIFAFMAVAALYAQKSNFATPPASYSRLPVETVIIEKQNGDEIEIEAEVAEKPVDLQVGLMYREHMEPDQGMIFLMGRTPGITSFWMKNTLIPLDMIFIAQDGRIAHIHRNATPRSETPVSSREPVTGVLELNGGRADELGIAIGDRVKFRYFTPASE